MGYFWIFFSFNTIFYMWWITIAILLIEIEKKCLNSKNKSDSHNFPKFSANLLLFF